MITPLSASSLPDRSRSRSQPLSRSQSPALSASSHEFACQLSLCHEERFLEDLWSTTCLQASTSPLASFTPPLSLAHSLQPLDLIDRCQPPVLCATDCDIVHCVVQQANASPNESPRAYRARPNTQVALTAAAPTALHTRTQSSASHTAPTAAPVALPEQRGVCPQRS